MRKKKHGLTESLVNVTYKSSTEGTVNKVSVLPAAVFITSFAVELVGREHSEDALL